MDDRELGEIGTLGICLILIAFVVVLAMGGCASERYAAPVEVDLTPTYSECRESCLLECESPTICTHTGLRAVGTRNGRCICAGWDA